MVTGLCQSDDRYREMWDIQATDGADIRGIAHLALMREIRRPPAPGRASPDVLRQRFLACQTCQQFDGEHCGQTKACRHGVCGPITVVDFACDSENTCPQLKWRPVVQEAVQ